MRGKAGEGEKGKEGYPRVVHTVDILVRNALWGR